MAVEAVDHHKIVAAAQYILVLAALAVVALEQPIRQAVLLFQVRTALLTQVAVVAHKLTLQEVVV